MREENKTKPPWVAIMPRLSHLLFSPSFYMERLESYSSTSQNSLQLASGCETVSTVRCTDLGFGRLTPVPSFYSLLTILAAGKQGHGSVTYGGRSISSIKSLLEFGFLIPGQQFIPGCVFLNSELQNQLQVAFSINY